MSISSTAHTELKQPKSILVHPVNFVDYIQVTLGVVEFQGDYDHTFMAIELFMTLINRVNIALRKGVIGKENKYTNKPRKKSIDMEIFKKCMQVYHGNVWLYQRRDEDLEIDSYRIIYDPDKELRLDEQPLDVREELIKLPALEAMSPTSLIKDRKEFGVKIRDFVPVRYAWWGYDHIQLATSAHFAYYLPTETRAIFESMEDVITSDVLTDYVSREYFNKVIKHLLLEFEKNADEIFVELHQIIQDEKFGYQQMGEQEVKDEYSSLVMTDEAE